MTSEKIKVVISWTNSCNICIPLDVFLSKNTRKLKKVLNRLHKHRHRHIHMKGIDHIWLSVINDNLLNNINRLYHHYGYNNHKKILLPDNIHNIKSLKCTINNNIRLYNERF